jgi:hypothetical protein
MVHLSIYELFCQMMAPKATFMSFQLHILLPSGDRYIFFIQLWGPPFLSHYVWFSSIYNYNSFSDKTFASIKNLKEYFHQKEYLQVIVSASWIIKYMNHLPKSMNIIFLCTALYRKQSRHLQGKSNARDRNILNVGRFVYCGQTVSAIKSKDNH